jgi:hypothetical protein
MVLRLNQETRAPSLHVPGTDRTRCHPTSWPPGHFIPRLCDHPRSSAPGLPLLPRSSSLHAMPHLPPTHHETSKRDSPNETKIKQNNPRFEFKPHQVSDSSQSNQGTNHLVSHLPNRRSPLSSYGPRPVSSSSNFYQLNQSLSFKGTYGRHVVFRPLGQLPWPMTMPSHS